MLKLFHGSEKLYPHQKSFCEFLWIPEGSLQPAVIFYMHLFTCNHRISYSCQPLPPESVSFALHWALSHSRGRRKKESRRRENWVGRVEPGNTSLNRRWTLSQPSSPDKTHSTKQGRHCSTVVPLHPNSTWLSWWRNGATDNTASCGLLSIVHCAAWGKK